MTIRDYADALPDLDRAIALRPTYVNALMNRGDFYNFYYQIDRARALADYNRVLALGPAATNGTSVCGHMFLAKHNGWNLGTFLDMPRGIASRCD
jgi:tetratricopeptide (TPR) repeat protein